MSSRRTSLRIARGLLVVGAAVLLTTAALAAPGNPVGSPQHTWAPNSLIAPTAGFGEGNTNASIKMKWGTAPADALAVTICDSQSYFESLRLGAVK